MKTCTKCNKTKPVSAFGNHRKTHDGLRSSCKECAKTEGAAWYVANSERKRLSCAKYYAENLEKRREYAAQYYIKNAEKKREYYREYYLKNAERKREYSAKWYAENKERHSVVGAKWNSNNQEKRRAHSNNRRARKQHGCGKLSNGIANKLYTLQGGKCVCCGKPLGDNYHLDHIMPLALGGPNTDDNMQLLRAECNQQKHAKHPIDFMQQRGYLL